VFERSNLLLIADNSDIAGVSIDFISRTKMLGKKLLRAAVAISLDRITHWVTSGPMLVE
jgi:hypothetical protein